MIRQTPENKTEDKLEIETYINGQRVMSKDEIVEHYDISVYSYQRFMEINQPRFFQIKNKYLYLKASLDKMLKPRTK